MCGNRNLCVIENNKQRQLISYNYNCNANTLGTLQSIINKNEGAQNVVLDESSEEDSSSIEDCIESLPVHNCHYDIDPEDTTPELNSPESPDVFDADEVNRDNEQPNKIPIGTNTDNVDFNELNMETIGKCYTLGFVIGRALTMMSPERREICIHKLLHCFEPSDLKF